MPRPVRVHVPGALYVVAAQAVEGHQLFRDPDDYQAYLSFLQGYRQQYGFKLFAFALLPDRLHLVIELTNDATISEIMHALHSRYTKHVMKRYGQTSHVFQNRFRSTVVEKAPSLLPLTGYVHRLPQVAGLAADARAYPWSSCAAYMTDGRYAGGLDLRPEVHEALQGLSASERYETVVEGLSAGDVGHWQRQLQKAVVGSPAFEQMVREKAAQRTQPAAAEPRPQPVPQPHTANRFATSALTISLAVAVMSLSAAGLYAKNLATLRQTVKALARERISITQVIAPAAVMEASHHVTTFTMPSRLAGTTWDVHVIAMDGPNAKTIHPDELRFMGRRVTSSVLAAQGFPTSNYTLALQPDGSVLWESMLTSRAGETVCWRGEWKGEQMRGVMTRQLPEQPAMNFTFIGVVKPVREAAQRDALEVASLEGTEWEIRLMPMYAQSTEAIQQDHLAFTQRRVSSTALSMQGFSTAHYTVTTQPNSAAHWETIQTNTTGELVSWQGEWNGHVMHGMMTRQFTSQAPQRFTFVGVAREPAAIRSET